MQKRVLLLLAEGFEEVEAVTPIDYLRRAGIEVTVAAAGSNYGKKSLAVKGSHGIEVIADAALNDLLLKEEMLEEGMEEGKLKLSAWDAVVVPGGGQGSDNLASSKETGVFLKAMAEAGKLVCAICAAPARVLSPLGLLTGKKFTCFPGEEEKVMAPSSASQGAQWMQERVVVDGNLITSRGAGSAGEFACAVIGKLVGEEEGKKLAERVLL